ncbi:MAG: hypothetical protein CUN52_13385 [Phototrophicales bacterium]|jgi:glycosyltransferase involved in cell wall biosynthesis|nr:MAG: hypothetical protein CUN52_13385 [Phototrophicales bacterium]
MTNNRPVITAYCLEWHVTISSAFHELLVKPLAPYADIRLTAWDGKSELPAPREDELTIFCELPPTEKWLAQYQSPVVWIPMADYAVYPPNMHNHSSVRVVAFSRVAETIAQDLAIDYLRLKYYIDPEQFPQASFDGERVLLYWNRTGLLDKRALLKLCQRLKINRLIFRSKLDPFISPTMYYELPAKIGRMHIHTYSTLTTHADYLQLLNCANIFIAPRKVEGVGLAFLEAMASGCCVIAFDDVTMNEYICHGKNGLLFQIPPVPEYRTAMINLWYRIINKLSWKFRNQPAIRPIIRPLPNWRNIRHVNIAQLGANARQSMADGYKQWIASIPAYADFVLG